MKHLCALLLTLGTLLLEANAAGIYSHGLNDPTNVYDAPVPGFVGPDGEGLARLADGDGGFFNARNYVNPLFFGWAASCRSYAPADAFTVNDWGNTNKALGPVTGDVTDVVSLGDLSAAEFSAKTAPGQITLVFAKPITNKPGADFVVFENALVSGYDTGGAGAGGMFSDLAYVEVSSNGTDFARFPAVSLTPAAVGAYGSIDPTNVFGLAGKHANSYGDCWGTPFDLSQLATHPLVTSGSVKLNAILYVRVVDIPGRGDFLDGQGHPIYDPWLTTGSAGFDLEAIGNISQETTFNDWQDLQGLAGAQRGAAADPDGDGVPNLLEYAFSLLPLTNDTSGLPKIVLASDRVAISFSRDTRKLDLIYEVQASSDLVTWTTLARSTAGGSLVAVSPYSPTIADTSDSNVASIGVIRREIVNDVLTFAQASRRFLRVRVSLVQ